MLQISPLLLLCFEYIYNIVSIKTCKYVSVNFVPIMNYGCCYALAIFVI